MLKVPRKFFKIAKFVDSRQRTTVVKQTGVVPVITADRAVPEHFFEACIIVRGVYLEVDRICHLLLGTSSK